MAMAMKRVYFDTREQLKYINLSNKGNYTRLCKGYPIGAGILVAIMGPLDYLSV